MKIDFSQIIEKFNQWDVNARYAVFGSVLLMLFLLDFFTILGFQWRAFEKINSENQAMQENTDHLKANLQRISEMNNGLKLSRSQFEVVNARIRSLGEVSSVVEDVSRVASECEVRIEQVTPQSEFQQALISSESTKYYALPIVIQATSGYHMFGHFINKLESSNLFFTLSNLTIEDRTSDSRLHSINATLKVVLSDKNTDGQKK
ncbi:MAG: type 4a pilus biogenesis protein PilO [Candidatus Omnitrophica bacterium]|nr:type 4a pilus biogenesis protein PilO [Candidatus Omnitrophota bacterium]